MKRRVYLRTFRSRSCEEMKRRPRASAAFVRVNNLNVLTPPYVLRLGECQGFVHPQWKTPPTPLRRTACQLKAGKHFPPGMASGGLRSRTLSCWARQIVRDVQASSDRLLSCAASSRDQSSRSSYCCYIIVIALLLHCPSGARGRVPLKPPQ